MKHTSQMEVCFDFNEVFHERFCILKFKRNPLANFHEIIKVPLAQLQHHHLLPIEIKEMIIQKYLYHCSSLVNVVH
ncbi:MAG: hypothetical protein LBG52_09180 [Candidatus Peribacteria bacterium]|nr:hypothetical protein [Candidatus Peribacteria bacterium]